MSIYSDAQQLKETLDNGDITFEEFLSEITPNPQTGIWQDYINQLITIVNDDKFASLSKSRQNYFLKKLQVLKLGGDEPIQEIFNTVGINTNEGGFRRLKNNILNGQVPVYNIETSDWETVSPAELTPEAKAVNGYEEFNIYGNDGFPIKRYFKGVPRVVKDEMGEENIWFDFAFPNGIVASVNKTDPDRKLQKNSWRFSEGFTSDMFPEGNDFINSVILNPNAKEEIDNKISASSRHYKYLLRKTELSGGENQWINDRVAEGRTLSEIIEDIKSLPEYIQGQINRPERDMQSLNPLVPNPKQGTIENLQSLFNQTFLRGQQTKNLPQGMPGPGSVPTASSIRPGEQTERTGGLPQLSDVRNTIRGLLNRV